MLVCVLCFGGIAVCLGSVFCCNVSVLMMSINFDRRNSGERIETKPGSLVSEGRQHLNSEKIQELKHIDTLYYVLHAVVCAPLQVTVETLLTILFGFFIVTTKRHRA